MTEERAAGVEGPRGRVEVVELTPAQQSFARRVAESKATAPHVYFETPLAAPASLAALVAASAQALRAHPLLNGAYRDGHVELHSRVNVAVGVEAGGTLALPVVHDADDKDLGAIAAEIQELAQGAGSGTLAPPAFAGATFTVIDMSASGAASYIPVLNRGHAATLGAGTEALTLACDGRVVQGGEGAVFLRAVIDRL